MEAIQPLETLNDYQTVSQWIQEQLGSREQFNVCTNSDKPGDTPYLLLTKEQNGHRLVFEDTTLQQGRVIDFKLYMNQHIIVGYRFIIKDEAPKWTSSQRLNEHASDFEAAEDAREVIEGDGTISIPNIIQRAIQYFSESNTQSSVA